MTVKVQFLLLPPEGRRSLLRRRLNQNRPGSNKDNVRWVGFSRPGPGEAILYKQKGVRVLPKEAWDPYSEERVQHAWCVGFLGLLPGGDMIENVTCSFLSATGNTEKMSRVAFGADALARSVQSASAHHRHRPSRRLRPGISRGQFRDSILHKRKMSLAAVSCSPPGMPEGLSPGDSYDRLSFLSFLISRLHLAALAFCSGTPG